MIKRFLPFLFLFSSLCASFDNEPQIAVNNRILISVNGKTFSVLDVKKQMDIYLNRYYPDQANSAAARYQFYSSQWRGTLDQMINSELILSDAEGKDLKITDSDVREELQDRFGPNVAVTLDKLGLSYEEAKKMIYDEKVVQQMSWFKVNSKALLTINPQTIKSTFKEFCQKNPPKESWKYEVLSVRSKVPTMSKMVAEKAYSLLAQQKDSWNDIAQKVQTEEAIVQVSQVYEVSDKELSASHKETLQGLPLDGYSQPISQISRTDSSSVERIFHLIDHTKAENPLFSNVSSEIEYQLLQQKVAAENDLYTAKLRDRFGITKELLEERIPLKFEPFSIK